MSFVLTTWRIELSNEPGWKRLGAVLNQGEPSLIGWMNQWDLASFEGMSGWIDVLRLEGAGL